MGSGHTARVDARCWAGDEIAMSEVSGDTGPAVKLFIPLTSVMEHDGAVVVRVSFVLVFLVRCRAS